MRGRRPVACIRTLRRQSFITTRRSFGWLPGPGGKEGRMSETAQVQTIAPARHRATPALPPRRRERDRVDKPALVRSETTNGRMR